MKLSFVKILFIMIRLSIKMLVNNILICKKKRLKIKWIIKTYLNNKIIKTELITIFIRGLYYKYFSQYYNNTQQK